MKKYLLAGILTMFLSSCTTIQVQTTGETIGEVENVICYSTYLANADLIFWGFVAAIVPFAGNVEPTCVLDTETE